MRYISTRGDVERITASQAIVRGIAPDEGLYVPEQIPPIPIPLEQFVKLSYKEMAFEILKLYLDFTDDELQYCVENAYSPENFDTPMITPLKSVGGYNFLELYHGRTLAFKDLALSILPYLMKVSVKKQGISKKIVILTATSGDTGKAALEGFKDVDGISIMVFYPNDGVSDVQKLQMTTQEGANTSVIGIHGNFDDAQTGVKNIFTDSEFKNEMEAQGYMFSSANSINIGRLIPQIVYYFNAYAQLVVSGGISAGDKIEFTVPTGNFGNILAAYYAKKMGLPISTLICASNSNKVLYDFFRTDDYDKNREFVLTMSPSMDILISSNLERYLYDVSKDPSTVKKLMGELKTSGKYSAMNNGMICGEYVTEEETLASIKKMFEMGYTLDTHTAVAFGAYEKYRRDNTGTMKNIIVSTASPYKFADSVIAAVKGKALSSGIGSMMDELSDMSGTEIPEQIKNLDKKEIRHKTVCEKSEMKGIVRDFVKKVAANS